MKKNIISLGLDLSLTGTGVVVLNDGKIVKQRLIKSKPISDGKPSDEVKRIRKIVEEIELIVGDSTPTIAVIEGLAFMVKNATALVQLAALNYMTRAMLMDYNVPFLIIAPTSLKKFVTGNGAAKKDVMLIETYKRWGVSILNDNECDAYGLARLGYSILQLDSKPKITQIQQEVITLVSKQL